MDKENNLTYGRTSVYNLNYHIIWGTKDLSKVLNGNVERQLKSILWEISQDYGFTIQNLKVIKSDQLHLLISAPPKLSVTNLVRWLKGISARKLFKQCPELQTSYWKQQGRHLWGSSYYVESIGITNQAAIAKYLDDQKR